MHAQTRLYKHKLINLTHTQRNLKAHKKYQPSASYSINWPHH